MKDVAKGFFLFLLALAGVFVGGGAAAVLIAHLTAGSIVKRAEDAGHYLAAHQCEVESKTTLGTQIYKCDNGTYTTKELATQALEAK